jgi:hypothetical protein
MKKKLLLFTAILILSSFSMNPSTVRTPNSEPLRKVLTWTEQHGGMTYRIFTYDVSVQVINVTKEQLEVEKLRLEIRHLKNK